MSVTYRAKAAANLLAVAIVPAVNDLFLVLSRATGNTNTSPTCSDDNGGTYTLIGAVTYNGSADTMAVFVRNEALPNTTSTTVTLVTGAASANRISVTAWAGSQRWGASAILQSGILGNQASGTTPAITLGASVLTANTPVGFLTVANTLTVPAGWTNRESGGAIHVDDQETGFTSATVTWGSTNLSNYAVLVVELDASPPFGGSDDPSSSPRGRRGLTRLGAQMRSRSRAIVIETPRIPAPAGFSLTHAPDGYGRGEVRASQGSGLLRDQVYYVHGAAPVIGLASDSFAPRIRRVKDKHPHSRSRFLVGGGDAPLAAFNVANGGASPTPALATAWVQTLLASTNGWGTQTNGVIDVTVQFVNNDQAGAGPSTSDPAGWSEVGWTNTVSPIPSVWTNRYTLASLSASTFWSILIAFPSTGISGVISVEWNLASGAASNPHTDQATGAGDYATYSI